MVRVATILRDRAAAYAVAPLLLLFFIVVPLTPARADCVQVGSIVSCTGTTTNYNAGTQTNLDITVQSGATVIGVAPTNAIKIQNSSGVTGNTLTNNGTINGFVLILSVNPGTDTFVNNAVLKNTDPNASLDVFSMAGTNFTQNSSGTFYARVDQNGFNDYIFAYTATLHGRFVAVVQPGLYPTAITYSPEIKTTAGVTGAFDSVTASSPFFTAALVPSGNNLDLTLTPIAFNAVAGLTPNEKAVADALQSAYAAGTPTGNAATFFSNLFAATSVTVYDQLSGAGTSGAQDAAFDAGDLFNNAMLLQSLAWLNGTAGAPGVTAGALPYAEAPPRRGYEAFAAMPPRAQTAERWRAWLLGFGATRSVDGDATLGTASGSTHTAGGGFGVDRQFGDDLLVGVALGGSTSTFSTPSLSTDGHVDGGHIGVYGIRTFGAAYVAAMANYARFDNATNRTIVGVGPTELATGSFASDQLSSHVEMGWRRRFKSYSVTPFAALEPAVLYQHAYTESPTTVAGAPGVLGLSYVSNTVTSLPLFLGTQIDSRRVFANGQVFAPYARLAWVHEFEPKRKVRASFVSIPGTGFTVDGARAASDGLRIGAGGNVALTPTAALFLNLNGEFSNSSRALAAMGGARMVW